MLLRTHVMFAIFMILLFVSHVSDGLVFIIMVLVATVIPDLDSSFSSYGRHLIFRPLQFFVKHRGIIHSFTTAVVLSALLAFWFPIASLGFFIGYCVHIFTDSFTIEGVQPFWPLHWKSNGPLRSGGRIEEVLFFGLIVVDVLMLFAMLVMG